MWASLPTFWTFLSNNWLSTLPITSALKILKARLKDWNKTGFNDIKVQIDSGMARLQEIQNKISNEGFTEDLFKRKFLLIKMLTSY